METANQTMGLSETLNGLNATSSSNGIDVHMMLPTEYGAVAILSASGYGNTKKLRDETDAQKRTTTGNSTGVYFTGDRWEIMASHIPDNNKYNNSSTSSIGSIISNSAGVGWHDGDIMALKIKPITSGYYQSREFASWVPNNTTTYTYFYLCSGKRTFFKWKRWSKQYASGTRRCMEHCWNG